MRRFLSTFRPDPDTLDSAMGVVAIFALVVVALWISHGLGLPTGGDELLAI